MDGLSARRRPAHSERLHVSRRRNHGCLRGTKLAPEPLVGEAPNRQGRAVRTEIGGMDSGKPHLVTVARPGGPRRRGGAPRARSRHGRVQLRLDVISGPCLLFLSLVSLPLVIAASSKLGESDDQLVLGAGVAVWAAFVANVAARIWLRDTRTSTMRLLRFDLVIVVGQPTLALGGARIAALGLPLLHAVGVAIAAARREQSVRRAWRRILDHPLRMVVGAVLFLWLLWSSVVLYADQHFPHGGDLHSIGDALWWGAATMTTVGYGDVTPQSPIGRGVAVAAMVTGIAAFSVVTAKLAEMLLASRDSSPRSAVDVSDHTLLLGWSPKVVAIVRELIDANARLAHADVVVLSSRPHADVERDIAAQVPELARSSTTVHCRTGSTCNPTDLTRVHPETARSVIVLGEGTDQTSVVTSLLALLSGTTPLRPGVRAIAEVADAATAIAVRSAFGERVQLIEPEVLLTRVTAQSCRQPGLGLAYEELLDFTGSEFYITAVPEATAVAFGDLLNTFPYLLPGRHRRQRWRDRPLPATRPHRCTGRPPRRPRGGSRQYLLRQSAVRTGGTGRRGSITLRTTR